MTSTNKLAQISSKNKLNSGFTIVELLVVIVVIGILAAITIVSYSGITTRANIASIESDLSNNSKILKMYSAEHGGYPTVLDSNNCPTLPEVSTRYCLKFSSGNTFTYSGSGANYSLSINRNGLGYYTTNNIATSVITPPTLISNTVASIATTSAVIGGTLSANGGANVTNFGVCYGLTANPTNCVDIEQGALAPATQATLNTVQTPTKVLTTANGSNVYMLTGGGIRMYSRDPSTNALTALTPASIAAGDAGTSDLATSTDDKYVYAVSGTSSSDVYVYMYRKDEATGLLTALSPNRVGVYTGSGVSVRGIAVSPDNKHLYVAHDGYVFTYSRDQASGLLTKMGSVYNNILGRIALSPDGLYMYTIHVDGSNNGVITVYSRNLSTGALTYSSERLIGNNVYLSDIVISSDGNFLYASISLQAQIRQFSINKSNGQLTPLTPSFISTANSSSRLELSIDNKTLYISEGGSHIRMFSRNTTSGLLTAFASPYIDSAGTVGIFITPDDKGIYSVNSGASINTYNRSAGAAEGSTFTKSITGLTSGTTYHYRTFSTNSAGTSYSTDSTFVTL